MPPTQPGPRLARACFFQDALRTLSITHSKIASPVGPNRRFRTDATITGLPSI